MAAPNYDEGSCCIYEGWRFGSVRRKPRRLGRKIEPDRREALLGRWKQARIFGVRCKRYYVCRRMERLLGKDSV